MSLPRVLVNQVRERANFACEYCGVAEAHAGGELTVDHYLPVAKGGDDSPDNLVYCCSRCNSYKAVYWPQTTDEAALWNPRADPRTEHFVLLTDGSLFPLSETGTFTIARLRLNRPQLVEHRVSLASARSHTQIAAESRELLAVVRLLKEELSDANYDQNKLLKRIERLLQLDE
jgi:hypothetical protein